VEADPGTASEKKWQWAGKQYSYMTEEHRHKVLCQNRENNKGRFTDATLSPVSIMNMSSAASMSPSPSKPVMQTRPSNNGPAGIF
jgi:hypothetical protein